MNLSSVDKHPRYFQERILRLRCEQNAPCDPSGLPCHSWSGLTVLPRFAKWSVNRCGHPLVIQGLYPHPPLGVWYHNKSLLSSLSSSKNFGPAWGTRLLSSWLAILHGYGSSISPFPFGSALHTIHLHWLTSLFVWSVRHRLFTSRYCRSNSSDVDFYLSQRHIRKSCF